MSDLLLIVIRTTLAITIGIFLLFYFLQRRMIYYPLVESDEVLLERARREALLPWNDLQGNRIGWTTASTSDAPPQVVFLIFHGNAGNASHRAELARKLVASVGETSARVFIAEYPGYGARQGSPSQPTMTKAGREALEMLQQSYPNARTVLVGESIGSGVAAQVASVASQPPDGLLLLTPFDRLETPAKFHYPWLPVGLLLRDRWESDKALRTYAGRVAILFAEEDEIVPAESARALAQALNPDQVLLIEVPGAGHNDLILLLPPSDLARAALFAAGIGSKENHPNKS